MKILRLLFYGCFMAQAAMATTMKIEKFSITDKSCLSISADPLRPNAQFETQKTDYTKDPKAFICALKTGPQYQCHSTRHKRDHFFTVEQHSKSQMILRSSGDGSARIHLDLAKKSFIVNAVRIVEGAGMFTEICLGDLRFE
jgi:hypothetical protein